ncbi:MAG: hypothetical protein AB7K24_05955 [Gemmataceae bacterium]
MSIWDWFIEKELGYREAGDAERYEMARPPRPGARDCPSLEDPANDRRHLGMV